MSKLVKHILGALRHLRPSSEFAAIDKLVKYLPRVLKYLRPYWKLATLSVIVTVISTPVGLLSPWPMKVLVDNVLGNQPLPAILASVLGRAVENKFSLLVSAVIAGLAITVVSGGLGVIGNYVHTKFDLGMTLDFRSELFQHAQRLSMSFHDQRRSGMLIYIVNSMASAPTNLIMTLLPLADNALTLVGMFWISFHLDRQLALLSLVVVPFLYYSVGYYSSHIQTRLLQVKSMEGETLSIIHEAMSMLRVIIAFGREDHEYRRFRNQGERANDARVKLTLRQTLFSLVVNTTSAAGTALVLGFGAYHVMQGKLTVGELLVVMTYIGSVYKPLEAISGQLGSLQDQLINLQMAFGLLDTEPEIKDKPGAIGIRRVRGQVAFEGVDFNYKNRPEILKGIWFEAQAGQVVAIVGPTGAGKTTLVSLIPRFYDPNQGRILIDGIDVREMTLKSLRQQISIVLQEPLLFSGSIADNIRYGRLDASMDEVIKAAKAANAHDFIMALPNKYDTDLGERGAQLSGGERQRISVARAFLKDAPILILDEPTSSIDSKTEAIILDALDRLMIGRTTFMVAHRLSTIRNADIILVLNRGCLVERGTHEELLLAGGLYKQLYEMQTGQMRRRVQQVVRPQATGAAD
jgi:ATP-binding cassette subfamily B protein